MTLDLDTFLTALYTTVDDLYQQQFAQRRRLFGAEAAIGKGGSDRDWYYGCKLLVSCTPEGVSTGFMLAPASTEDRWVADAFMCWRADEWAYPLDVSDLPSLYRSNGKPYVGSTGPLWPSSGAGSPSGVPYIADNGIFGSWWQRHWREDCGAELGHLAEPTLRAVIAGTWHIAKALN